MMHRQEGTANTANTTEHAIIIVVVIAIVVVTPSCGGSCCCCTRRGRGSIGGAEPGINLSEGNKRQRERERERERRQTQSEVSNHRQENPAQQNKEYKTGKKAKPHTRTASPTKCSLEWAWIRRSTNCRCIANISGTAVKSTVGCTC
jgi:hypothetical protein